MPKVKKKKSLGIQFLMFLIKLAVIAGIAYVLLTRVVALQRIGSNTMYPAIRDGDMCIFYRLKEPMSGEVVLYEVNGIKMVGRVVGIEEQTLDINGEQVVINGGIRAEEIMYPTTRDPESEVSYPVTLKHGDYFILNDYRMDKNDSRSFGIVKRENIEGVLIYVLRRRSF